MNTTVIMTVTITITMIIAMAVTKTMIMTMAVSKTIIMAMVAIMTKNMTINVTKISKQVQKDNFYCLLRIIKKVTKIQFAFLL